MTDRFVIAIPDAVLGDLHARLDLTRWPDSVVDDWSWGTSPAALATLLDAWRTFDWRSREAELNELEHHKRDGLHYLRAGRRGAPPLLLLHGWPDSFLRFETVVPLLADDFELVIPSIPGYGFSDRPTTPGADSAAAADRFAVLMRSLGHDRFGVNGGDIGSGIAEQLAVRHPDRLTGLHLTNVPYQRVFGVPVEELSPAEAAHRKATERWMREEGAYAAEHSTKPQTLAAGLTDSPAALASWFLEKFQAWTDRDVFDAVPIGSQVTNLMIYWATGTAGSAIRYYRDGALSQNRVRGSVGVRAGFALFPHDIGRPPRELAERFYTVDRWTELPRGGHFAAWEEPELLADEVKTFFLEDGNHDG